MSAANPCEDWSTFVSYMKKIHVLHLNHYYVCMIFISGRDCMVVGFTTTYAINAYHH